MLLEEPVKKTGTGLILYNESPLSYNSSIPIELVTNLTNLLDVTNSIVLKPDCFCD